MDTTITKKITSLLLLFLLTSTAFYAQDCGNVGVENGTFSGWGCYTGVAKSSTVGSGILPALNLTTTPFMFTNETSYIDTLGSNVSANRFEIMTPTSGNGGVDKIVPSIPVVSPYGGSYSVMLGNSSSSSHAEMLEFKYLVDSFNTNFVFQYAVVLEQPKGSLHPKENASAFRININDSLGNAINPTCGVFEIYGGQSGVGFTSFQTTTSDISYINWTISTLDLSAYIGQRVTLKFSSNDCSLGGHYGYSYLDFSCMSFNFLTEHCKGAQTATIQPPQGYVSYSWTANKAVTYPPISGTLFPAGTILPTNDTLQILASDTSIVYSCTLTPNINTLCAATKDYKLKLTNGGSPAGIIKYKNTLMSVVNGSGTTYQWIYCSSKAPVVGATKETFTPVMDSSYAVITNQKGCIDTSECIQHKYTSGKPCMKPSITNITGVSILCNGTKATLTSTISSVKWLNTNTTGATIIVNKTGFYQVQNTESVCKSAHDSISKSNVISIQADSLVKPVITASDTLVCGSNKVTLTCKLDTNYSKYTWTKLIKPSNANGNIAYADTVGTYSVIVIGKSGVCKKASNTVKLSLGSMVEPKVFSSKDSLCSPNVVYVFTDLKSGKYSWVKNGVLDTLLGTNDTAIVTKTGSYSINVNDKGCTGKSKAKSITIFEKPKASILSTQDTSCIGDVFLSAQNSLQAISYNWSFGDGSSNVDFVNTTHKYRKSGNYRITLIATNKCGSDTETVDLKVCSTVGLENLALNDMYNVYPNPFTESFTVELSNEISDSAMLEVFDLSGKVIASMGVKNLNEKSQFKVNMGEFDAAMYFGKLTSNKGVSVFKIVKQ